MIFNSLYQLRNCAGLSAPEVTAFYQMDLLPTPPSSLSLTAEQATRRREVENALLVQTLCGRRPGLDVRTQLLRYIAGELSREQAFANLYVGL